MCDMQAVNISYGKETIAAASDEDDDEGGGEGAGGQDSGSIDEKLKKMMVIPGQVNAVSMEVQQDVNDTGAPPVAGEYNCVSEIQAGSASVTTGEMDGCVGRSLHYL